MSPENLFDQKSCYIKGEKKEGEVIAVTKSLDRERVCFLLPGESRGRWFPKEALFSDLEAEARKRREAAIPDIEQALIEAKSASVPKPRPQPQPEYPYQPTPAPTVAQPQPQYQPAPAPAPAPTQPQPQYQPAPTPTPAVAQQQPQYQPAPTPAPAVAQQQSAPTPAPAVAQQQPQYQPAPTPAPAVAQPQPQYQPAPTPAPTVAQQQPQYQPAPTVAQTPAPAPVAQPQPQPTPAVAQAASKEEEVTEKVKEQARQEAKQVILQGIGRLQQFSMDVYNKIQNQAAGDIQTTFLVLEETRTFLNQRLQRVGQSGANTAQEALQFIAYANQRSGLLTRDVTETISNYWSAHWLEGIVNAIKILDPERAKKAVAQIRQKNPSFAPGQIAQELINEKVIWATTSGAVASATPGVGALVDLSVTLPLLVQMVYEIGFAYDDKTPLPQQQGEILTIFALGLGGDNLGKLGLGFLLKHSPIPSWSVDPVSNGLLFLTVGYASCQYLEAKAKQAANPATSRAARTILENQIDAYLAEAKSEKSAVAIQRVFAWAISLKQQLGIG